MTNLSLENEFDLDEALNEIAKLRAQLKIAMEALRKIDGISRSCEPWSQSVEDFYNTINGKKPT